MIADHYPWIDLLARDRVECVAHLKMFLYHGFLVGVSALNDDWVPEEFLRDHASQEIGHVPWPLIGALLQKLLKSLIYVLGVLHCGCLLGELHLH